MKCINCGHAMTTKKENVPYTALPGTVLVGVDVSRCPSCGESETAIPAIDELNRMLAEAVIRKTARLNGGEVRFLRSYLGYSGADFGKLIGVDPATVSNWETNKKPIGHQSDLLLRSFVIMDKRIDKYPIASFAEVGGETAKSSYAFSPTTRKSWKPAVVAA